MASPESLRAELEMVWAADTSVDPAWTPERPSLGHCAVTALLVDEYVPGADRIVRVPLADGGSHYFNLTADGAEIDLTRDQFDDYQPIGEPEERTRTYLLSNADTLRRWERLRDRLGKLWFGS